MISAKVDMLRTAIRGWYKGSFVPNEPGSRVIHVNRYKRHWTSDLAHTVVDFYLKHWQWIIATAIALIGLFLI